MSDIERYMSSRGSARAGVMAMDVFGEYVDPELLPPPPAPCRTIEITDEVRALDAALQAAREAAPASVWKIKAELSADNLRTGRNRLVRREPVDERLRVAPDRTFVVPASSAPKKVCRQCKAELSGQFKRNLCSTCLPPSKAQLERARKQRVAAGRVPRFCACGGRISNSSKFEQCGTCRDVSPARVLSPPSRLPKPVPVLQLLAAQDAIAAPAVMVSEPEVAARPAAAPRACPCGKVLRKSNRGTLCGRCHGVEVRRAERAAVRAVRPECAKDGCSRLLRAGKRRRADGLCAKCGTRADVKRRGKKGDHARRIEEAGVRCAECPRLIKPGTKTGLCVTHAAASRTRRTVLHAATAEAFRADRLFARLATADKWALLERWM